MWNAAVSELFSLPHIDRRKLLVLLISYPFLQPLLPLVTSHYVVYVTHTVSAMAAGVDFAAAYFSAVNASPDKRPRAVREGLERLCRYFVAAMKWLVICMVCIACQLSIVAGLITCYIVYLTVVVHPDGGLGRWVRVLWGLLSGSRVDSPSNEKVKHRITSLKDGANHRCVVTDEGPHFRRATRGCLLSAL
jgi:hypothetical protein